MIEVNCGTVSFSVTETQEGLDALIKILKSILAIAKNDASCAPKRHYKKREVVVYEKNNNQQDLINLLVKIVDTKTPHPDVEFLKQSGLANKSNYYKYRDIAIKQGLITKEECKIKREKGLQYKKKEDILDNLITCEGCQKRVKKSKIHLGYCHECIESIKEEHREKDDNQGDVEPDEDTLEEET